MKTKTPFLMMLFCLLETGCITSYERQYSTNFQFWCQWSKRQDPTFVHHCRESLASVLPFHQSFEETTEGKKAKQEFIELFVQFIYAPLKLPPSEVLGTPVASFPKNMEELVPFLQVNDVSFSAQSASLPEQLNFTILSSLLQHIDEFIYVKNQPKENGFFTVARSQPNYTLSQGILFRKRVVFLYSFFWNEKVWYKQMAFLFHESFHSVVPDHLFCGGARGFNCDEDMSGPYGKEIFFLEAALHGAEQAKKHINETEIQQIVLRLCEISNEHILSIPEKLKNTVNSSSCVLPQLAWIAQKENLTFLAQEQFALVTKSNVNSF